MHCVSLSKAERYKPGIKNARIGSPVRIKFPDMVIEPNGVYFAVSRRRRQARHIIRVRLAAYDVALFFRGRIYVNASICRSSNECVGRGGCDRSKRPLRCL